MKTPNKQMTATWLRDGRLAKGLTQKELAEHSNISIRSIQRIENGDLIPRSYTLKTLAAILGLSFEEFMASARQQNFEISDKDVDPGASPRPASRIILSIGITFALVLLATAYVAQSPRFPETTFEGLVFSAGVLIAIMLILFALWRKRN